MQPVHISSSSEKEITITQVKNGFIVTIINPKLINKKMRKIPIGESYDDFLHRDDSEEEAIQPYVFKAKDEVINFLREYI